MNDNEDVFDEDLMRELGLTPEDMASVKVPPPPAKKAAAAASGVSKSAAATMAPAAPPAPKPRAPAAERPVPPEPPAAERPQSPAPVRPEPAPVAKPIVPERPGEAVAASIPVHLAAVLAKRSLPLKEVVSLDVGEVIDFKKSPDDPIDLVANGKLVAKAELVLVDGKVGARIVKLIR